MGLSIKFKHPHFPDGHLFGFHDLGVLKNNGDALEVGEDQERQFIATKGMTVKDAMAANTHVEVSGDSSLSKEESDQLVSAANPAPAESEVEVTTLSPDEAAKVANEAVTPPTPTNQDTEGGEVNG